MTADDADSTVPVADCDKVALKKTCSVGGCDGIMYFRDAMRTANAQHTLEWPWHHTWVCSRDSAHFEIVGARQYQEIRRVRRERELQRPYVVEGDDTKSRRAGAVRRAVRGIAALFRTNHT